MKTIKTTMDIPYFPWANKWANALSQTTDIPLIIQTIEEIYQIDAKNYSQKQIEAMVYNISQIVGIDPKTNKRNQEPELHRTFMLNDKEYGFIPNFSDISFGDLMTLEKAMEMEDYLTLFSCLYREVKSKDGLFYQIKPIDGVNEEFENIPLGVVEGALSFFFKSFQRLSPIFPLSFLQNQRTKMNLT